MSALLDHQLELLLAAFLLGTLGTALLFRKPSGHRVWQLADLVWVLLGGVGAIGAIVAGQYSEDSGRVERQIDLAYAAISTFENDAARFRLRYCETAQADTLKPLCDKADFLSASTASTAQLPIFVAITDEIAPLTGLNILGLGPADKAEMAQAADRFDPDRLVVFASRDPEVDRSLTALRTTAPGIAADYQILAQSYDRLIEQVTRLRDEWRVLEDNAFILLIQVLSLSLVSFAAPFRLGKSLVDLRDHSA